MSGRNKISECCWCKVVGLLCRSLACRVDFLQANGVLLRLSKCCGCNFFLTLNIPHRVLILAT